MSTLGRSFTSLAGVFNILHTFVCGDDVRASTINANELISDGALNVNSETKALRRQHLQTQLLMALIIAILFS